MYMPVKKEMQISKFSNSLPKNYENVDLDHVYIEFNQEFHSWSEGERVVNLVSTYFSIHYFRKYMPKKLYYSFNPHYRLARYWAFNQVN